MATDCTTCCDALQCEVDAIKLNVTNLFGRTDDLNDAIVPLTEENQHVYRVVSTAEELYQAIALEGSIYIDAAIVINVELDLTLDGTEIIGMNESAAIIRQHNNVSAISIVKISAKNVTLKGLKITSNHPLVNNELIQDIGITISDTDDVTGLKIINCEIYNVYHGILRTWNNTGGTYAPESYDITIQECYLHSLVSYAIFILQHTKFINILHNRMVGRDPVQDAHVNTGNGIWLGNNANYAIIDGNDISYFGRHGIEYWNSQHIPLEYTDGNRCGKIINNSIHDLIDLGGGNFCISAFGNEALHITGNTTEGGQIGIEIYCDRVTDGEVIVTNNHVSGASLQSISVNGVVNGLIQGNVFKDTPSLHGMQIIFGSRNIVVQDNKFVDCGQRTIFINGIGITITAIQIANNGWITVAENLLTETNKRAWALGQQVTFKDIVGTTELNDNYYTITERDTSGATGTHKIRLGIDMSGFTPWVSGGYFKESYRNIVIQNNVFTFNGQINGGDTQAVYLTDLNEGIVVGNTVFHEAALSANKLYRVGYASVYGDFTGAANTGAGYFVGQNRMISFEASN